MNTPIYDVDYFINKFENIPEELWCTDLFTKGNAHCSLGHCGMRTGIYPITEEPISLHNLLHQETILINDGPHPIYQQPTPKQRILAALRDVKKLQQPKEVVEVKEKIVYVTVDKKVRELQREEELGKN